MGDTPLQINRGRHGLFAHFASDGVIRESLHRYGEWAEAEIFLLSAFLSDGDVVIDGGANIGTHAIAFSRAVGDAGEVLAVEAEPNTFPLLTTNVVMSGATNVRCRNALLGAESRLDQLPLMDWAEKGNFGVAAFVHREPDAPTVPMVQQAIDDLALPRLRLLKLDVEAMEIDVLRGARATLERCRPVVYYEQAIERGFVEIKELLGAVGYGLYWHLAPAFNAANLRGSGENMFGPAADRNILAVPDEAALATARGRASLFPVEDFPPARPTTTFSLPADPYPFYPNGHSWDGAFALPDDPVEEPSSGEAAATPGRLRRLARAFGRG